jgi:hypothetical protein
MKLRLLVASLLTAVVLPALAHDPAAHSRRAPAKPAECAAFDGKDPATIDLKDAVIKAAYDKCEAARKDANKAADAAAEAEHDH